MRAKKYLAPALILTLCAALMAQFQSAIADRAVSYDLLDPVIDVQSILMRNFADESKLDPDKLRRAMIDGLISSLDDPHTMYIPPADLAEFNKELRGTYVGIGCEVNVVDDYLTIVSPMDDSPALEAGIMAGDVVLEIEGESTLKMAVTECIRRLTGAPGTQVRIKVRHLDGVEQEYTITRRQITTRTVKGLRREGDHWNYCINAELGLAYLRVTQFNETTMAELHAALEHLHGQGMNGMVLDLRDNPGGGLPAAVEMADLFLDDGMIVSVRPRRGREQTFAAQHLGTLPQFPMIVMVNGQSASASEIVAGALQENHRAKVLGTRTFGKGSVQEVRDLDYNRGTLKYTTALYYLPSGRNLNRSSDSTVWGVDPDPGMVVPVTDEQYLEAFRARRDFEVIRSATNPQPPCADAQWIRANLKDEQLALAVEALAADVSTGQWPQVGKADAAVAAFDQELSRAMEHRTRLMEQVAKLDERISELNQLGAKVGRLPLLPPDVDLIQGTIAVRDKNGNLIGTYRIEGGDLESAFNALRLTPVE